MKELERDLFLIKEGHLFDLEMPEAERFRAEVIIENGGWCKAVLTPLFEKRKEEQERQRMREDAELHNWVATAKYARRANIIAWLALAVALLAVIVPYLLKPLALG